MIFKLFILVCLVLFFSTSNARKVEVLNDHLYFTVPLGVNSIAFEMAGQDAIEQYIFNITVAGGEELYITSRGMERRDCRRAAAVYLDDVVIFVAPGGRLGEGYDSDTGEFVCNGDEYNSGLATNLEILPISVDSITATYDPLNSDYDLSQGVVSQIIFNYNGDDISDEWDINIPADYQNIITDPAKEYIVYKKDTVARRDSSISVVYNLQISSDYDGSVDRSTHYDEISATLRASLFNGTTYELAVSKDDLYFKEDLNIPFSSDYYVIAITYESSSETDIVNFHSISSNTADALSTLEDLLTNENASSYDNQNILEFELDYFIISANENRDGNEDSQSFTSNGEYIVPQGIYELRINSEADGASSSYGYNVQVQPYDKIAFRFESGYIEIDLNGELMSVLPGSSGSLHLAGNTLTHTSSNTVTGSEHITISYFDVCPHHFTNLHSDFNPILMPESSLYLVNNEPSLNLNFKLPNYYYEVDIDFSAYCTEQPSITSSNQYCDTVFKTAINYATKCPNLTLEVNPDDDSEYLYQGELIVTAKLKLDVAGVDVERELISPINFQVTLTRTIEISSEVELLNDHKCATESECNDEGCCEDGFCNCNCAEHINGYAGDYCENDIQSPTCGSAFNQTYTFASPHGGCISLDGRNLIGARDYQDNSGESSASLLVDIDVFEPSSVLPGLSDDDNICFIIGTTTVTHNLKDSSDNEHTCSYEVVITDDADPYVDCHKCQDGVSGGNVKVCEGIIGNLFEAKEISYNNYQLAVDDYSLNLRSGVYSTYLPGQLVDLSDDAYTQPTLPSAKFLDCNCVLQDNVPAVPYVTKSWNSWNTHFSFDTTDGVLSNTPNRTDPNLDGDYNVEYTVTDAAGNENTCVINVIYDILPPTCDDFYAAPAIDVDDKNYSVAVPYTEADLNAAFGISGQKSASLLPDRNDGDVYHVGYLANSSYSSTYSLEDNAGNLATCSWEVFVDNPTPCIYPV
jgi:hypothetical protein